MTTVRLCRRLLAAWLLFASSQQALAQDGFIQQPKLKSESKPNVVQPNVPVVAQPEAVSEPQPEQSNWHRDPARLMMPEPAAVPLNASLRWVTRGETTRSDSLPGSAQPAASRPQPNTATQAPPSTGQRVTEQSVPLPAAGQQTSSMPTVTMQSATVLNAVPTAGELEQERRSELASLVSAQIMASKRTEPLHSVHPLHAPPGWQAVAAELQGRIASCESLLRRNAYFSARQEAEAGAEYLAKVIDGMENRFYCELAWSAAQTALDEAEDFNFVARRANDSNALGRIVQSHRTPVLRNAKLDEIAPMTAAQHYRSYAQYCLAEASQNHPWASEVFYAIGRCYQAQADAEVGNGEALRQRAVTFYRTAVSIDPGNSIANNQLGFLLLQLDRPQDARQALMASIQAAPSRHALQNLMETCRRLNDAKTMHWANSLLQTIPQQNTPDSPAQVLEVSPQDFATLSPRAAGPAPASR